MFNSNYFIYHIILFFLIQLVTYTYCICLFISGVPQPDIVWYKDAVPISPVKTPRYRVLAGGSLQVNGLLPDDTGMFQCFARNQAGEVQTNTYLAVTSEFIRPSLSPTFPLCLSCSHTLMHKYMWTFISSASLSVCLFLSQSERL